VRDDDHLLAHYLAVGGEPWNHSLESAWLDYELRAWAMPRLPTSRPIVACNVGIGVGGWDDWLGHMLQTPITSVDRDPEICRIFELRQRREHHPHPARVICGDIFDGVLDGHRFDVITAVGSTLSEAGDRARFIERLSACVSPGGTLLIAEVGDGEPPVAETVRTLGSLWIAATNIAR
jgi:SAM-dependent methyltransferase